MNFYTQLTYAKPSFLFSYKNPILLIGSCFVENIGTRMTDLKFQTDVNPFGTLYNPASISHASLTRIKSCFRPVACSIALITTVAFLHLRPRPV